MLPDKERRAPEDEPEKMVAPVSRTHRRDPFLIAIASLSALGLVVIFYSLYALTQDYLEKSAIQVAARYNEAVQEFRTIYTSEVVNRVTALGIEASHDYRNHPNRIPLPATLSMALGARLGGLGSGARMRLFSDYPFPWRTDGGPSDDFEREALVALRLNPDQPFYRFQGEGGFRVLRYATADRMREACVSCHNTHPDTPKNDWKIGDVRGVLEVSLPAGGELTSHLAGLNLAFVGAAMLLVLGTLLGFVTINRQRKSAAALSEHAQALEHEVLERRLAEQRLQRSNKDLLEFAHVASHDLNEPLRKIAAFGDLLHQECGNELGDEGKLYLGKVIDASVRMRQLIDGLLAYSRVSRGTSEKHETDLGKIAREAAADLSHLEASCGGKIVVHDLPSIEANEIQMRQLFQNIMANALKFRRHGVPPVVRVEGKTLAAAPKRHKDWAFAGPVCCVEIADNGIGFEEKYKERIFEIFERLHGRHEYEGTGIGLAVCRKVVEAHQGTIEVCSTPGVGTTFTIYLPMRQNSGERNNT